MTAEQRHKASIDLTLGFFRSYYSGWRLAKVLSIKKILASRYEFLHEIALEVKNADDISGEATIAHELKNGLYFDAISECVQYVEDLFALIKATEQPDYFVRSIITYKAGQISNYITKFKPNIASVVKAFHIPEDLTLSNENDKSDVENGIDNLQKLVLDCTKFYDDYHLLYNQYKHGLTVGMRPFGNLYSEEQIEKDKNGQFAPYLTIFDNINIKNAIGTGRSKNFPGMLMPYLTENITPFISELNNENNFLRLVPVHNSDVDIEFFADFAFKIKACIQIFIYNYTWKLKPENNLIKFQLPSDYRKNTVLDCSYSEDG